MNFTPDCLLFVVHKLTCEDANLLWMMNHIRLRGGIVVLLCSSFLQKKKKTHLPVLEFSVETKSLLI